MSETQTKNQTKSKSISDQVMDQIHDQHIKMHPHVYFILATVLFGIGLASAILVAIFFSNVVIDVIRAQHSFHPLWISRFGWWYAIFHLPWLMLFIALLGLVGGVKLLRRHESIYQHSRQATFAGLLVVVVTAGAILDLAGVNNLFRMHSVGDQLYNVGSEQWISGVVATVDENARILTINSIDGHTYTVNLSNDTLTKDLDDVAIGDFVHLIASCDGYNCQANAIGSGVRGPGPNRIRIRPINFPPGINRPNLPIKFE